MCVCPSNKMFYIILIYLIRRTRNEVLMHWQITKYENLSYYGIEILVNTIYFITDATCRRKSKRIKGFVCVGVLHIVIQTNSTPSHRIWGINICKSLLLKEVPIMKINIICKHCLETPALINTIADGSRLNISLKETPEALLVYEQLLNLKRKFYPGCLLLF